MKSNGQSGKPTATVARWQVDQQAPMEELIAMEVVRSGKNVPRGAIIANHTRLHSASGIPDFPLWYEDKLFVCRDCNKRELWTARQQQWWYEVAGGEIETTANRCKACRRRKRSEDAASTERTRQHRRARAEKKAFVLAGNLAALGSDGFTVLEKPVKELPLRKRTWAALEERGFRTVGDLVAHDSGVVIPGVGAGDMALIRTQLENPGLTFIGAPVPRL